LSIHHNFNIKIATEHSIDVAVFLNNIAHWVRENQANERNFHDNRTWTYNSESAFTQIFPYWTRRQMQRIIKTCIDQKLLLAGNYNKAKYDRTKWYTLSDSMVSVFGLNNTPLQPLLGAIEPNGSMDRTKRVNGMNQMGQPIPNTKTQIENTDVKTLVDSTNQTSVDYKDDSLFMAFYSNYPNKQKPRVAYKAFLKLKPDQTLTDKIVSDVSARSANNWKDRPASKIPHPSTYLNAHEWEGDIILSRDSEAGNKNNRPDNNQTSWIKGLLE
jgi:hypothetical protein